MTYYRCESQTPQDLVRLLLAAEQTETCKKEEHLLVTAGEDDLETLKILASGCCQHEENRKVTGLRQSAQYTDKMDICFIGQYLVKYLLTNIQHLFKSVLPFNICDKNLNF